jgi:hypothetical protein
MVWRLGDVGRHTAKAEITAATRIAAEINQ